MADSEAQADRDGTGQLQRSATVDDGVLRVGPARIESLSATQKALTLTSC